MPSKIPDKDLFQMNVKIDKKLADEIVEMSAKMKNRQPEGGWNQSKIIRDALRNYLPHLKEYWKSLPGGKRS